jgi:Intraflagellar transport complex B protein 46 C terminal
MPDINALMQVWPAEVEALLTPEALDGLEFVDLSLEEYARTLAAILGIPVYSKLVDSLHCLFTLFLEARANQHFIASGN